MVTLRKICKGEQIPIAVVLAYVPAFSNPPWKECHNGGDVLVKLGDSANWKFLYVFYEGDEIIGGAVFLPLERSSIFEIFLPRTPERAWLEEFFIHPKFHGRGLGKEAFSLLLQEIRANGFRGIASRTHANHPAMISIFESHGFTKIGENSAETGGQKHPRAYFLQQA